LFLVGDPLTFTNRGLIIPLAQDAKLPTIFVIREFVSAGGLSAGFIPSRARSAVVMPDTGLPPGSPCQAPSLLWSPPALKEATRAFRLADDRIAIGARGSLGASSNTGEGAQPATAGWPISSRLRGSELRNVRSTEKERHSHIINSL
jgi:hypothetical protein